MVKIKGWKKRLERKSLIVYVPENKKRIALIQIYRTGYFHDWQTTIYFQNKKPKTNPVKTKGESIAIAINYMRKHPKG